MSDLMLATVTLGTYDSGGVKGKVDGSDTVVTLIPMSGVAVYNADRVLVQQVGSQAFITNVVSSGGHALPTTVAVGAGGPWGTAVPGSTSGVSFTCRAGTLTGICTGSGYNSFANDVYLEHYIDGVLVNTLVIYVNTVNSHMAFPPLPFTHSISAGTHYWAVRAVTTLSDGFDRAGMMGVVTP